MITKNTESESVSEGDDFMTKFDKLKKKDKEMINWLLKRLCFSETLDQKIIELNEKCKEEKEKWEKEREEFIKRERIWIANHDKFSKSEEALENLSTGKKDLESGLKNLQKDYDLLKEKSSHFESKNKDLLQEKQQQDQKEKELNDHLTSKEKELLDVKGENESLINEISRKDREINLLKSVSIDSEKELLKMMKDDPYCKEFILGTEQDDGRALVKMLVSLGQQDTIARLHQGFEERCRNEKRESSMQEMEILKLVLGIHNLRLPEHNKLILENKDSVVGSHYDAKRHSKMNEGVKVYKVYLVGIKTSQQPITQTLVELI